MNPLDFPGPAFLRFYLVYGSSILLIAGLLRLFWRGSPSIPPSKRWSPGVYPREGDAYAIALLRGGPREVVRALLGRLVADGLLRLDRCTLRRADESPREPSLTPLEEAALEALLPAKGTAHVCLAERRAARALAPQTGALRRELEQEGLVPDESRRRAQRGVRLGTLLAVSGPGLARLFALLDRGRNLILLILLVIASLTICLFLLRPPRRTPAGKRYLEWLQGSHRGLVRTVSERRRGEAGELALAAGIYGLGALPTFTPLHQALREQPAGDAQETAGEDTGGASSCGGGCGGAGCGGCGGG